MHVKRNIKFGLMLVAFAHVAVAEVITVDQSGNGDFQTIQEAINFASDGDVILVEPGYYTSTQDNVVDLLGKALVLRSTEGPEVTAIDGEGTRRGIIFQNGETTATVIDGFSILDCFAPWYDLDGDGVEDEDEFIGGGVLNVNGSSPTILNCHFLVNEASADGGALFSFGESQLELTDCLFDRNDCGPVGVGGAISVEESDPILTRCTFLSNEAKSAGGFGSNGGAISLLRTDAVLDECVFEFNRASYGGGVSTAGGKPSITNCHFRLNQATSSGGGVAVFAGGEPVLSGCVFERNDASAGGGGAYFLFSGLVQLSECTFVENTADEGGGIGVYSQSNPMLSSCLMTENSAALGGAMYSFGSGPAFAQTIVCMNGVDQLVGEWIDQGGNTIDDSCQPLCPADVNQDGFVNGTDLTFVLGFWGPCLGMSDCAADLTGDLVVDGADITIILAHWGACP